MLVIKTTLSYLALTLTYLPSWCEGTSAYIYYSNAACIDSNTISGDFQLAYDDSSFEGFGYSVEDYEGECMYFDGGSLELSDYSYGYSSILDGYCVTCDGVAACSGDGTCDDVSTVNGSNLYSMSQEQSSNSYQKTEVQPNAFKAAQDLNESILLKVSQNGSGSTITYSILGVFIGMCTWFILVAGLEAHRQRRVRRQNSDLSESLATQV